MTTRLLVPGVIKMSEFDLNKAIMKWVQQFGEMMSNDDDNDDKLADLSKFIKDRDYEEIIKHEMANSFYVIRDARYLDLKSVTTGQLKSSEKATEFIEKGNKQFKKENSWKDSLELYTQGVIHAPPNSSELARAYANRSAALSDGGLYDDVILDIGRALEIGYPDNLKPKLYIRRSMCSLLLNGTLNSDARKDIDDACQLLLKMNSNDTEYVNEIVNKKLSTISSMKTPQQKIDYQTFLPKIVNENTKLMGVTDAVELQYSEKYGRQVVATRDIRAGEAIYVHKPYASIVESTVVHKYCWHCSKQVWAGVPCHQCVSVIYCNEKCRDEAWQEYHDIECLIIPQCNQIVANSGTVGQLALKITAKALKEAGSLEKLKEKIDKINTQQDCIKKCFSGDVFDNTKYEAVYSLSRNAHIEVLIRFALFILHCFAANTEIFGKKYEKIDRLEKNKWMIFMGALILRHMDLCVSNSKRDYMEDEDQKEVVRGTEMFPFFSLINNNCDPNVIDYHSGNVSAMITLQQIKKGEQIFISYHPPYWSSSPRERKASLLKYFNFDCDCTACKNEWDVQSINSFPSGELDLPLSIKKKLDYFQDKSNLGQSETATSTVINYLQKISLSMELMNLHQEDMEYPTQEMMELKLITTSLYKNCTL